jgi:MSHA pilin protein MshC
MHIRAERGFTLIELVVVLILVGILAVAAIPRLVDKSGFAARGAKDFLGASLRYAQKSAVAMRRNVCVVVSSTGLAVTYASNFGSTQSCAAGNLLMNPGNNKPYNDPSNVFPGGATVVSGTSFIFDAVGRPLTTLFAPTAAVITLTVNGLPHPFAIRPETGYVRASTRRGLLVIDSPGWIQPHRAGHLHRHCECCRRWRIGGL